LKIVPICNILFITTIEFKNIENETGNVSSLNKTPEQNYTTQIENKK